MSLETQIPEDLKTAMKAKDKVRVNTLRAVLSGIKYLRAEGGHDEISDDDVIGIVNREVKKRRDSIEMYESNGRPELAENEQAEVAILMEYLPAQLTEEEIRQIVTDTIAEVGATSPADKGKLMGALMPKVKGKADGKAVNTLVSELLS
ncbi:GatB/YqeY domain-containing protein [Stomatohabitans albus]|uniref:GatB/YqeY domain-containing protein n=2 Tax=Stomatohabitans albus TaxID=3110766 RepID=UPI00300C8492